MNALIPLLLVLAAQDAEPPAQSGDVPIPAKVQAAEPVEENPPEKENTPAVAVRTEANGDRIEEYTQNGKLYMVKVTPARGPSYYLMDTDGNGRFNRDERDPRVSPVHWTIYEWD